MIRTKNFIVRKWTWACQNKLFWMNIALAFGTVAFVFFWPGPVIAGTPSDFRLRAWGMLLQLVGAYTVWRDLTGTAGEFGAGGILHRNWIWLKTGFGFRTVIMGAAGTTLGCATMSGRMTVRPAINKEVALDQRMAVLESYVEHMDRDLTGAFNEMSQQKRDLTAKIDEKAGTLQAAIHATETRLKNALVGNYSVLLFGAVWLFIGIVLSSVAAEIAKLVAHQYAAVFMAL